MNKTGVGAQVIAGDVLLNLKLTKIATLLVDLISKYDAEQGQVKSRS